MVEEGMYSHPVLCSGSLSSVLGEPTLAVFSLVLI